MRRPNSCAWRALGFLGVLAVLAVPAAGAAEPATPVRIGGAQHWDAYSFTDKSGKVCYLVGRPEKSEPASLKRGRVDALVTHRPKEKSFDVVNFDAGYALKPNSNAELTIDGRKFTLFTHQDSAWTQNAATDKAVTEAMAKGRHAVFKGTSAQGVVATDSYSLDGFGDALAAIDKACGVKH
ncbi:MAG TPA: invasion associated locus B family protein [Stellaceae bacterium]|nr:invasion associated locus B family protein [Stellaceae bacterium]